MTPNEAREHIDLMISDFNASSWNDKRYSVEWYDDEELAIVGQSARVCAQVKYDARTNEYDDDLHDEYGRRYGYKVKETTYTLSSYYITDEDGAEVMATKQQRQDLGDALINILAGLTKTE